MKNLFKSIFWFIKTANYYYGFDFRNLKCRWIRHLPKVKYIKPENIILEKSFRVDSTQLAMSHTPDMVSEMKKRAEYEMDKSKKLYSVFVNNWIKDEWVEEPRTGDYLQYRLVVIGSLREW